MARPGIEPRTSDFESGALLTALRGPAAELRLMGVVCFFVLFFFVGGKGSISSVFDLSLPFFLFLVDGLIVDGNQPSREINSKNFYSQQDF